MYNMGHKIYVCCYCEAWGSGGIESFCISLIRQLDRSLYKVDIVAARKLSGFYDRQLEELGIRLILLSGSTKKCGDNYRRLSYLFQCRHYDVVHINAYHAVTLLYAQCAKKSGIKTVAVHSHSAGIKKGRGQLLKSLAHLLARYFFADSPTVRIACSEASKRFLYLRGQKVQIIPNGIDVERFRYSQLQRDRIRRRLGIERAFVTGMTGRLCTEKNQAFGIEVFAELKKERVNAVLLIVGEGETEHTLRGLVRNKGLTGSVIFYGASRHVSQLMQGMDVLLMPSETEGFGMTAIEAQACGLPVVCSDRVPKEAVADERLVIRISLKKSRQEWVKALAGAVRQKTCGLRNTDYDISTTADAIKSIWG